MESTSYVFPFRMVFFYLVTTGWMFDISLCVIIQSIIKNLSAGCSVTVVLNFARSLNIYQNYCRMGYFHDFR